MTETYSLGEPILSRPWFLDQQGLDGERWVYREIEVNCSFEDLYPPYDLWNCSYRLNVARVSDGPYLYWSLMFKDLVGLEHELRLHPLYLVRQFLGNDFTGELGGVVADNELTRVSVKWLSLSNAEMAPMIGNSLVPVYRQKIISSLQGLWD